MKKELINKLDKAMDQLWYTNAKYIIKTLVSKNIEDYNITKLNGIVKNVKEATTNDMIDAADLILILSETYLTEEELIKFIKRATLATKRYYK